jgi:hypothetical protein
MAHRHKEHKKEHHKKHGGKVHGGEHKGEEVYSGKGSHTEEEAEEKKHGGKVHGHKGHHRLDKRARGGRLGHGVHKHGGGDMTKSPFAPSHVRTNGDA